MQVKCSKEKTKPGGPLFSLTCTSLRLVFCSLTSLNGFQQSCTHLIGYKQHEQLSGISVLPTSLSDVQSQKEREEKKSKRDYRIH